MTTKDLLILSLILNAIQAIAYAISSSEMRHHIGSLRKRIQQMKTAHGDDSQQAVSDL